YLKNNWMRFTLALSVMGALATVAHAESFSVQVPFAFEAAGKSFPAGAYSVESIASGLLVIRGATSAESASVLVMPSAYATPPKSSLVFDKTPDSAVLSQVNLS